MAQNTKEYQQKYYRENRARIIERQKEYYKTTKPERLEYAQTHYQENRNSILEQQTKRQQENRVEITKYHNTYVKKKSENDPVFRLRKNVSTSIYSALKANGSSKQGESVMDYLPYTTQELKDHLEEQFEDWMTWDNHGVHDTKTYDEMNSKTWKWNIDHIIPQSKLPYSSMNDDNFKKCWGLNNLRPLLSKTNLKKGDK